MVGGECIKSERAVGPFVDITHRIRIKETFGEREKKKIDVVPGVVGVDHVSECHYACLGHLPFITVRDFKKKSTLRLDLQINIL